MDFEEIVALIPGLFEGEGIFDGFVQSIGAIIENFQVPEVSVLDFLQGLDFSSINGIIDSITGLLG